MATIRDVARESGVSVATVSYVLNGGPRSVRAETRERVLATMRRLNYRPNATARSLVRRRNHTLGVLLGSGSLTTFANPYTSTVLDGVLSGASQRGYNVTLFTADWRNQSASALFRNASVDGIVMIAPTLDSNILAEIQAHNLSVVAVSTSTPGLPIPYIDVDNYRGGVLAVEHLLSLGHTRIAHLSGDTNQPSVAPRRAAYRTTLEAAGLAIPETFDTISSYNKARSKADAIQLLSLSEPPTAIFAGNDVIAFSILEAARERGLRVPQDLAVVGFDDGWGAALVTPPLTTVRQPLSLMASEATLSLIAMIEGDLVSVPSRIVEPELVIRSSTGPAPCRATTNTSEGKLQ